MSDSSIRTSDIVFEDRDEFERAKKKYGSAVTKINDEDMIFQFNDRSVRNGTALLLDKDGYTSCWDED